MKEKWNEYWKQLENCEAELNNFLESSSMSDMVVAQMKKFLSSWNKQKKLAAEIDQYITPVAPLEIKLPFSSDEFTDMWQRWKEYLNEQHGQMMRTRSEKSALEHLNKLSKGNDEKAVEFLRYAMANRYRNFFAIEERDTKQPAKEEPAGKSAYG